jgi:hypothetical protein
MAAECLLVVSGLSFDSWVMLVTLGGRAVDLVGSVLLLDSGQAAGEVCVSWKKRCVVRVVMNGLD